MTSEYQFLDKNYSVDLESLKRKCRVIAIKQKLKTVNELKWGTEGDSYSGFVNSEGKPHIWGINIEEVGAHYEGEWKDGQKCGIRRF